jgi:DtxR family transcriptional regulator, Mn-dependent transcriptional regulator
MSDGFHPPLEEYLEAIHELEEEGTDAIQARLAERLGHSAPSVSEMIRRLRSEGYLEPAGKATSSKAVRLTKKGRHLAESVVRKHRLAERLLTDVIGLPWHKAHVEACRWEHVISDEVEARLVELLHNPTTCPHGNPIPGSAYTEPDTVPLSDLGVGSRFTVSRIPEELEFTPGLLDFLEQSSLQPGVSGELTATSPDGTVTVSIDDRHVGIGAFASRRILVAPGA